MLQDQLSSMQKNLRKLHDQYSEMKKMGKMKLKRSILTINNASQTKQQEVCEFDFSNYPYYYNYPEKNISLDEQDVQMAFIRQMTSFVTDDFEQYKRQYPETTNDAYFLSLLNPKNTLKQAHQTLYNHFRSRISYLDSLQSFYLSCLRNNLQKSANSLNSNELKQKQIINSLLQKCGIQRRSYLNKVIRMSEHIQQFKFGEESKSRVYPKKNEEGESKFIPTNQQIQFSNIQKTDVVVYARRMLHQQRIMIQLKILQQILKTNYHQKEYVLSSNKSKLQKLNKIREQQKQLHHIIQSMIEEKLRARDKKYFEQEQNIKQFKQFCNRFCIVRSKQISSFPNIHTDYESFPHVPFLKYQLQNLVTSIYSQCLHFKDYKLPAQVDVFIIKANSYISIKHRTLRQNIDSIVKQSSKDQDNLQMTIRMQINSIFEQQISHGLLSVESSFLTYSMISSVSWDNLFKYTPKLSQQAQLVHDKLNRIQFFDPDIRGLFALLDVSQEHLRDFTFQYVEKVINKKNIYNYLKMADVCPTKKHKIIEILVRSLNKQQQDVLTDNEILYLSFIDENMNKMLMATAYNLIFTRCLSLRFELFHILNAQNSIQKTIVSKLYQLHKSQIPFQLSDSFNLKFSRYQAEQVQQYLNKKDKTHQYQLIHQNDKIEYIKQQGEDIPMCFVRCQNRRDNQQCHNQYIVYKSTLTSYKQLCKKMQKICCHYIQKHENNLPFSDFNQMIDRYQIMMNIMDCEMRFNYSKLKLMEAYLKVISHTVSNSGVITIIQNIMRVKNIEYIINSKGRYFINEYQNNIKILNQTTEIINKLSTLFKSIESNANKMFKQRCNNKIVTNQMPEVSLNYYCLDSSLKKKQIKQQKQQQKKKTVVPSNASYYDNSQYFLQKDFKEYLDNNNRQTNMMDIYNKKRQELIGFNQKLTLNDQMLGASIWFEDSSGKLKQLGLDTYEYLWNIVEVISLIEQFQFQCSSEKLFYYSTVLKSVESFHPYTVSLHQSFDQNMLSVYLQKCSFDLTTFQQTLFKYPLNTLSKLQTHTLENYMNCQKLDLTSYRGLYLCVNFLSLIKHSQVQITNQILKQYYLNNIIEILKQYGDASTLQIDFFQKIRNGDSLMQFPEIVSIRPLSQNQFEYLFPSKTMIYHLQSLYTFSNCQFFKQSLDILLNCKHNYELCSQNFNFKLESKCLIIEDSVVDYMLIKQQLKKLEITKSYSVSKDVITEIIMFRDLMYMTRKKQQIEAQYPSINDIVFHKKYLNKVMNDLKNTSVGIYEASKYYKYREKHFKQLKMDINKLLKIMPHMRQLVVMQEQQIENKDKQKQKEKEKEKEREVLVFPDYKNILADIKVVIDPEEQTPKRAQFIKYSYQSIDTKARKYLSFFCSKSKLNQISKSSFNIPKLFYPLNICTQYSIWYQILLFLQNSLLLFSLQLSPTDNQIFRQLIINQQSIDDYLYQSSKYLLSPEYLNRLRRRALQSQLFINYQQQYRIFDNLKSSYKLFVKQMGEFIELIKIKEKQQKQDIRLELITINRNRQKMIYIAMKQLELQGSGQFDPTFNELYNLRHISKIQCSFNHSNNKLITEYSIPSDHSPFSNKMRQSLIPLFTHSLIEPYQYIIKHQHKFQSSSIGTSINPANHHLDNLTQTDRRFILQRINQLKQLCDMYNLIKNNKNKNQDGDIITIYYKLVKMRELVQLLKIQDKRFLDEKYLKIMEVKIHQGQLPLSNLETALLSHNKNIQNGKIYQKVSQRIINLVVQIKILQQIFTKYMCQNYIEDIKKQLNLLQYLQYDKQWQDKFKQQKSIKQLQNKVLVPKIKLNPFLSSPLCLTNYFIPHTSKLAFVQSFLNRLRNKVMQVELIDNQFGFLVKSHDLEECVQFLCKSFISFSQKQYQSRTRKLVLQLQMLDSELSLTKQDLIILKNRSNVAKSKVESLLKAEVFTKINSILLSYFNIKNRQELMIKKLTAIETQFHEDLTSKYLQFIRAQAMQNQVLMKQFQNFKNLVTGMFKSDIQNSCEILQDKLSQNISKIIGKVVHPTFILRQQQQIPSGYTQNQIHQKQLKKQNYLYKLRLAAVQQKYDNEIEFLKKKLQDKQKLLNSLLIQRRKSELFLSQLNSVNQQQKKCQAAYEDLKRKHEDVEHKNYRLTRLVEQANMKTSKNNFHLPSIIQNKSTISRNMSIVKDDSKVRSVTVQGIKSEGKSQTDWKYKYEELKQEKRELGKIIESVRKQCEKMFNSKLATKILEIISKKETTSSKIIDISPTDVKVQIRSLTKSVKLKLDT